MMVSNMHEAALLPLAQNLGEIDDELRKCLLIVKLVKAAGNQRQSWSCCMTGRVITALPRP